MKDYKSPYRTRNIEKAKELYKKAPSPEELKELLGRARAKKGMFEGDLVEGELEIGQIAGLIDEIKPAAHIVGEVLNEFKEAQKDLCSIPEF